MWKAKQSKAKQGEDWFINCTWEIDTDTKQPLLLYSGLALYLWYCSGKASFKTDLGYLKSKAPRVQNVWQKPPHGLEGLHWSLLSEYEFEQKYNWRWSKCADTCSEVESQIVDISRRDAEMEILQGFPGEISFEFLFFNRGYFTPTEIMNWLVYSDFSVSLSVQLPCPRLPHNSHVCFDLSPPSQYSAFIRKLSRLTCCIEWNVARSICEWIPANKF